MLAALHQTGKWFRSKGCFEVKFDFINLSSRQNRLQNQNHLRLFIAILNSRVVHKWDDYSPNAGELTPRKEPLHLFDRLLALYIARAQEWLIHEVISA